MAVKTAVVTGSKGVGTAGIKRVLGAGAGIAAGVGLEHVTRGVLPGGANAPVRIGNLNVNPFADTRRKKYRRINPTNPKALKRAMRRLEGFGEFAKAMGYSRPPKCIGGFKGLPKRKRASKCR